MKSLVVLLDTECHERFRIFDREELLEITKNVQRLFGW